jgi:cytochrome d ubiquinol oxidase subunit II
VFDRLTGRALPLVVIAGVCGLAALVLLALGASKAVRILAALGVAAVVWGWGVAQYPTVLPGTTVTLTNAGAPESTLAAVVVLSVAAAVIVVPSFVLLFILQGRRLLTSDHETTPAAPSDSAG